MFVADDYVESEALDNRVSDTLAIIRRNFRGTGKVAPTDARVGWRPMPVDGLPIVGFTPSVPRLYLVVMHAGVLMAPVVGRLSTDEIVAGNEAEALAPLPRIEVRIVSRRGQSGNSFGRMVGLPQVKSTTCEVLGIVLIMTVVVATVDQP